MALIALLAIGVLPRAGWGQPARGAAPAVAPRAPNVLPVPGAADRPAAAIRVDCNESLPEPICAAVLEAAREAASRSYRVVDPAEMERVLKKEPALRGCRREDCRFTISDQLGAAKLIDVSIQGQGKGHVVGTVSIYDPVAKGISGDVEIPSTRREGGRVRRAVAEAVEYVIGAQRLTATLRLDIKPEGAKVQIDGTDRGTVREVRLFLGPHTVRVEKVGCIPSDNTVNVTPAGALLEVKLQPLPLGVEVVWYPPSARVSVDGDPVDARSSEVEWTEGQRRLHARKAKIQLTEGRHQVQVLAEPGSGYESRELYVDVGVGRQRFDVVLPRLAQLHVLAPRDYTVRIDNQMLAGKVAGDTQELTVATGPGQHTVTAVSWRGRQRTAAAQAFAGSQTEVVIRPPSLVPGLVLGAVGLVAIGVGAALVSLDNKICSRTIMAGGDMECLFFYRTDWQGYTAIGVGGAALGIGIAWLIYNAGDNPRFHGPAAKRAGSFGRFSLAPAFDATGGALIARGRF